MNIFKKKNSTPTQMQSRTKEGTIFELAFLVLALLSWGFIVWLISHAPSSVPTHFNVAGTPDAWGSPTSVLFICVIISVVGAAMLAGAYFPGTINMPFKIETPRQIALGMRLMRILAILFLLLTVAIAASSLMPPFRIWPIFVVVALILVVTLVFTWLMWRAR